MLLLVCQLPRFLRQLVCGGWPAQHAPVTEDTLLSVENRSVNFGFEPSSCQNYNAIMTTALSTTKRTKISLHVCHSGDCSTGNDIEKHRPSFQAPESNCPSQMTCSLRASKIHTCSTPQAHRSKGFGVNIADSSAIDAGIRHFWPQAEPPRNPSNILQDSAVLCVLERSCFSVCRGFLLSSPPWRCAGALHISRVRRCTPPEPGNCQGCGLKL